MSSFSQRETKPKEFQITTRPKKVDIKTLSEAEKKAFYEELTNFANGIMAIWYPPTENT